MKNLILQEIKQLKLKHPKPHPDSQSNPVICGAVKEDSQLQKSSTSKTITFKSQSHATLPGLQLFKGLAFCFPLIDIDLSPKRVEFMSKAIKEEGGKIVLFKDQQISEEVDYLLVNPRVPVQGVLRKVERKIVFKDILDYNFVLDSLRESILLTVAGYSIYRRDNEGVTVDAKESSYSPLPSKMVKMEKTESLGYRRIRGQKEDALTEDEKFETKSASIRQKPTYSSNEKDLQTRNKKALASGAFMCQKGVTNSSSQSFSVNKFICDELMKLQKIYQNQKDVGRKIAYLKAVSAIRSLDKDIESESDLQHLRGVGSKIIKKVKELLQTGKLQKLERMQRSEKRLVIDLFNKIWGVGPNKAEELYSKGIRSIEQLRTNTELLNKNQKIGLRYYEDLQTKIPREKVTRIFAFVVSCFSTLVEDIEDYRIEVCGSYRRGRALCGDIDILICRKDHIYQKKLLVDLILELEKQTLLTDHLVSPSPSDANMSYMGICAFEDSLHHRIDIKYYPTLQYPYALLYFTGSDMFNRSMRLYASKKGIQLSDHGAVPRKKHPNDETWEGPVPQCETEEEIFKFLGLDFKTPEERDV